MPQALGYGWQDSLPGTSPSPRGQQTPTLRHKGSVAASPQHLPSGHGKHPLALLMDLLALV